MEQDGDDKDEDEEMIGFLIGAVKTRGDVKLNANLLAIETEGKKKKKKKKKKSMVTLWCGFWWEFVSLILVKGVSFLWWYFGGREIDKG